MIEIHKPRMPMNVLRDLAERARDGDVVELLKIPAGATIHSIGDPDIANKKADDWVEICSYSIDIGEPTKVTLELAGDDFRIEAGDVFTVIGTTGAGKQE